MKNYIDSLLNIKKTVKSSSPLIHCITNPISINDCANAVLSLGAKPIMAENPRETAEITAAASALCVNLGNITDSRLKGISNAAASAVENNIPIIIDAVGVTCSTLRKNFCLEFIESFKPQIIKGNAAEIKAVLGKSFSAVGIDSNESDLKSIITCAEELARKTESVVLSSGEKDVVTNGIKTAVISNGCKMMSLLTGTGCMLGVIVGTFMSRGGAFDSAVLGSGFFGMCGELADGAKGAASFRIRLIDNIFSLCDNQISDEIKIKFL